jgi:hypothetical protein
MSSDAHTQNRTHAHTHASRGAGGRRTDAQSRSRGEVGSRSVRALRVLRGLRSGSASETRGNLTCETRLLGSDGAPLGGTEREGAQRVTPAATPPSESRTEGHGVAQPAPSLADRPFGTIERCRPARADGAGRGYEREVWAGGRTDAPAREARRADVLPLVLVPYFQKRYLSRISRTRVLDLTERLRSHGGVSSRDGGGRAREEVRNRLLSSHITRVVVVRFYALTVVSGCSLARRSSIVWVPATKIGWATSQTALTATEAFQHVLCLHSYRPLKYSDAHRQ